MAYGDDRLNTNAAAARGAQCDGYGAPCTIFPMRRASPLHGREPSHHPLARGHTTRCDMASVR
jgi:hypothetical protein